MAPGRGSGADRAGNLGAVRGAGGAGFAGLPGAGARRAGDGDWGGGGEAAPQCCHWRPPEAMRREQWAPLLRPLLGSHLLPEQVKGLCSSQWYPRAVLAENKMN